MTQLHLVIQQFEMVRCTIHVLYSVLPSLGHVQEKIVTYHWHCFLALLISGGTYPSPHLCPTPPSETFEYISISFLERVVI